MDGGLQSGYDRRHSVPCVFLVVTHFEMREPLRGADVTVTRISSPGVSLRHRFTPVISVPDVSDAMPRKITSPFRFATVSATSFCFFIKKRGDLFQTPSNSVKLAFLSGVSRNVLLIPQEL